MFESLSVLQWTVISVTALCIGMSKTGVQGMMLLIVPYMAMAFGAKESTGVILPMLCMADVIAVTYYKRIADWKVVAKLLPTAILGFFVAIFIDSLIPTQEFRKLMGWTLALALGDDMERGVWQGKQMDEEMVVLCHLRTARRLHHHDWQCCRTCIVSLSPFHA